MSRHDDSGADLPPEALTVDQVVDDVAAVLDDAHVDSAVLYGTSYGTYIAAGLGVRHPGRVQAMILDSPLLSRHDIALVRDAIRGCCWSTAIRRKPPRWRPKFASSIDSRADDRRRRGQVAADHLRLRRGRAAGSPTRLVARAVE